MRAFGKYQNTMMRKTHGEKSFKVHRLIAEEALGKPLPEGVEIHHVDGNRANNIKSNLVLCPNKKYHQHLHARQRIQDAGYNPNHYHKCTDCEGFKPHKMFSKNRTRSSGYNNLCKSCDNLRQRARHHGRVVPSKL